MSAPSSTGPKKHCGNTQDIHEATVPARHPPLMTCCRDQYTRVPPRSKTISRWTARRAQIQIVPSPKARVQVRE